MVTKFTSLQAATQGKCCLLMRRKSDWFLRPQTDIFKIICNLPKLTKERAWMQYEHLTLYNIFFMH